MFLIKTMHHSERKPWEFLFVASIAFMLFQLTTLLAYLGIIEFVKIDILLWGYIFGFIYAGLVLLAFISQHDLILKNHLILISKKDDREKRVEAKVKKEVEDAQMFPSTPDKE